MKEKRETDAGGEPSPRVPEPEPAASLGAPASPGRGGDASRARRRRGPPLLLKLALSLLVALLFSLVLDRVLVLFGFPSEPPPRYAHPPNWREERETIEFRYEFRTNSQGLRYREIPLQKPASTRRVLVVGDSFTEGVGVSEEERFTERLERHFTRPAREVQFVNGGLSGTGPIEYGRLAFNVGPRYQVDGLLVCFFANDLSNMPRAEPRPEKQWFTLKGRPSGGLVATLWPRMSALWLQARRAWNYRRLTAPVDLVAAVSARAREEGIREERIAVWKSRLPADLLRAANQGRFQRPALSYGLLRPNYWRVALDVAGARAEAAWRTMSRVLDAIADEARSRRWPLAVAYLPSPLQYDRRQHDPGYNPRLRLGTIVRRQWLEGTSEVQRRLRGWARSAGVSFLDLTAVFRAAAREIPDLDWPLDTHWTARGHEVAARALAEWIEEEEVFPFLSKR